MAEEGKRAPWHVGDMTRADAEQRLLSPDNLPGAFLVRDSKRGQGELSLDMKDDAGMPRHYKIMHAQSEYFIKSTSQRCRTLAVLISHHQKEADGLCRTIVMPCLPPRKIAEQEEYTEIDDEHVGSTCNQEEYTPLVQDPPKGNTPTKTPSKGWKQGPSSTPIAGHPPTVVPRHTQPMTYTPENEDTLQHEDWYFGEANAEDMASKLQSSDVEEGTFLIRKSRGRPKAYTLCLRAHGQVKHYRIETDPYDSRYHISDGMKFSSLRDLVAHYKEIPGRMGKKLGKAYREGGNDYTASPQLPERSIPGMGSRHGKQTSKSRLAYEDSTPLQKAYIEPAPEQTYNEVDDDDSFSDHNSFDEEEHGPPDDTKPTQKVDHIVKELVSTEVEYVRRLKYLVTVESKYEKVIRANEILRKLFEMVRNILKLHEDLLLSKLEERRRSWETNRQIGDIMSQIAPFLKKYFEFMQLYKDGNEMMANEATKNSPIGKMLKEVKEDDEFHGLQLQDILIAPVQRVPRYRLLLQDYIKNLPENSPDTDSAKKALHDVMEAADFCNKHMATHQNVKDLNTLDVRIVNFPVLSVLDRVFIREEKDMKILDADTGDVNDKTFVLFSDILLICNNAGRNNKLSVKYKFKLQNSQIIATDVANTLTLQNNKGKDEVEVFFDCETKLQSWKTDIAKYMADPLGRKS